MQSSLPPETAAEPETATVLMVERWAGKVKSGVRARELGCFRDFNLKPQMKRSYDPATRLILEEIRQAGRQAIKTVGF